MWNSIAEGIDLLSTPRFDCISPVGILEFKTRGSCEIGTLEWLFDLDYPSQCVRQIYINFSTVAVEGPTSVPRRPRHLSPMPLREEDIPPPLDLKRLDLGELCSRHIKPRRLYFETEGSTFIEFGVVATSSIR